MPTPYNKEKAKVARNVKTWLRFVLYRIIWGVILIGGGCYVLNALYGGVVAFLGFLCLASFYNFSIDYLDNWVVPYLDQSRVSHSMSKIDDEKRARIEKALENTKEFTFQESLSPGEISKLIRLHKELDERSTRDIEDELQKAGVFNPHNAYYLKGKTIEEGLTLAVWQSRHDRTEAILRATEAAYTHATALAATAPDPQKRKEFERLREGAEQELRRLTGDRKERTERLKAFNGECVIRSLDGEIEQLVLKVEAGDYSVRLEDVRKDSGETKRATIRNDGDPFTLGDWGDVYTLDDTELVVKRRGDDREERKPLW